MIRPVKHILIFKAVYRRSSFSLLHFSFSLQLSAPLITNLTCDYWTAAMILLSANNLHISKTSMSGLRNDKNSEKQPWVFFMAPAVMETHSAVKGSYKAQTYKKKIKNYSFFTLRACLLAPKIILYISESHINVCFSGKFLMKKSPPRHVTQTSMCSFKLKLILVKSNATLPSPNITTPETRRK